MLADSESADEQLGIRDFAYDAGIFRAVSKLRRYLPIGNASRMLHAIAPQTVEVEAIGVIRRGQGNLGVTRVDVHAAATALAPADDGARGWKGRIVGISELLRQQASHTWTQLILLASAWGIPYAALSWAKLTDYWQLALVSVPAIIFSFYAILGRIDKTRTDWKLNRIKLDSTVRLAEIAEKQRAEEADKATLALQIASEAKKAALWQTNHANAQMQIKDLVTERDEALDEAREARQAASDANERNLESFKMLQDAEIRSQNLQAVIEAMKEDERKRLTVKETGIGIHDASATNGLVKPT